MTSRTARDGPVKAQLSDADEAVAEVANPWSDGQEKLEEAVSDKDNEISRMAASANAAAEAGGEDMDPQAFMLKVKQLSSYDKMGSMSKEDLLLLQQYLDQLSNKVWDELNPKLKPQ